VAEAGCYDMDRDTGQQQSSGVQVTEIVKPGMRQWLSRQSDRLVVAIDQLGHQRGNSVGIKRLAPFGDED
jgi:hypothetical protein